MADECDQQGNTNARNGPHLLTLPLEIRYEIYEYLHRRILTSQRIANMTSSLSHDQYFTTFTENAPLVNVILTNSQLRKEY
jgi:hypothetical protein